MRYILNNEGYIYDISLGADISCDLGNCTAYTGKVPEGYESIEEWYDTELDKLNAWKVVEGNLVFDEKKYNELQIKCEEEERNNATATVKFVEDTLKNTLSSSSLNEMLPIRTIEGTTVKTLDANNSKVKQIDICKDTNGSYTGDFNIYIHKKNMLVNEATSTNESGISFDVNDDRSVNLNGTATEDIDINITGTKTNTKPFLVLKKDTEYCLSGLGIKKYLEGESLTIPSSHTGKLTKFNIEGKSVQNGTPTSENKVDIENVEGKNKLNLIDTAEAIIPSNEITYSISNQRLTINGTGLSSKYPWIVITKNGIYSKNGTPTASNITTWANGNIAKGIFKPSKKILSGSSTSNFSISLYDETGKNVTSSLTNDTNIVAVGIYLGEAQTFTNCVLGVQLEEGTVATEYVPHNSLSLSVFGENWIDKSRGCQLYNGTSVQELDTGFRVKLTSAGNYRYSTYIIPNSDSLLGKTVRISAKIKPSSANKGMMILYTLKASEGVATGVAGISGDETEKEFTMPKYYTNDAVQFGILFYGNTNGTGNVDDYVDYTDVMLKIKNDNDNTYKPYQEQTATFPLSEGQKLYEGSYLADDGVRNAKWQAILDGSDDEGWTDKALTGHYSIPKNKFDNINAPSGTTNILCSHFKNVAVGKFDVERFYVGTNNLNFHNSGFATLSEFKQWLSNNPITIEYYLTKEEIVPYTPEQQEAYNQLQNLSWFEGVNNISISPVTNIECEYEEGQILKLYSYDGTDRTEVYHGTNGIIKYTDEDKKITQAILSIPKGVVYESGTLKPQIEVGNMFTGYETGKKPVIIPISMGDNVLERIGLYPSNDLYPANNLYPIDDVRDLVTIKNDECYFIKKVKGNKEQKAKETQLFEVKTPMFDDGVNTVYTDNELSVNVHYAINTYYNIVEGTNILHLKDTYESVGAINRLEIAGFTGTETSIEIISSKDGTTKDSSILIELNETIGLNTKVVIENGKATVIKQNGYEEEIENIYIKTFDNETYIFVNDISNLSYVANYMLKSTFTEYFCTRAEKNASIKVTEDAINLEVSKKVGNDEIISRINQTAEDITIDANRININGAVSANGNFKVDTEGNVECNNSKINGGNIELIGNSDNPTFNIYKDENKNVTERLYATNDFLMIRSDTLNYVNMQTDNRSSAITIKKGDSASISISARDADSTISLQNSGGSTYIKNTGITTPVVTQTSLENIKKNFEEVEDATSIVKNSEIYKYNFKTEEDTDKKHYGFVIGEKYNTPDEVISKSGEGIDTYSMCSILWKAVQEQQKTIELLQKEINNLKGESHGEN